MNDPAVRSARARIAAARRYGDTVKEERARRDLAYAKCVQVIREQYAVHPARRPTVEQSVMLARLVLAPAMQSLTDEQRRAVGSVLIGEELVTPNSEYERVKRAALGGGA